jgi:lysophospholipase L1-like esterase
VADARAILCFGDSNTWGCPPGGGERFPRDVRWTGVLQRLLGDGYRVIEEGLNGRTATLEHPWIEGRSGRPYLLPCCRSHAPLDLVVIYLGTNDIADRYNLSASDVAEACCSLAGIVRYAECGPEESTPPILVVCPPPIRATGPEAAEYELMERKSRDLGRHFAVAAAEAGVELLDLDGIVRYAEEDPIHLAAGEHRKLAEALEPIVRRLAP